MSTLPEVVTEKNDRGDATGITRREREILELIARGRSNAAIARQLQLSVRTVHKHLEHLYVKLDVHDRTTAAPR